MSRSTRLGMLARTDVRLVGRDRFLLGIGLYVVSVAIAMRFVIPGITGSLLDATGYDITQIYPLLGSYLSVFLGSQLGGIIFGFTLLEAREDRTIRALIVSPLPVRSYIGYRVLSAYAMSIATILGMGFILDVALPAPLVMLAIAAVGALMGAIWTIVYATYADNKVSAFALMKGLGGTGLIIIAAWFLDAPLEYLAGVFPPYWPSKAYWVAAEGGAWGPYLLAGLAAHLIPLAYFARRLETVARR